MQWLLYFFAGAGAIAMLSVVISLITMHKKISQFHYQELTFKNLRREYLVLEQMCDSNKKVNDVQMDAILDLSKTITLMDANLKELNKKMGTVWIVAKDWEGKKEAGPDG